MSFNKIVLYKSVLPSEKKIKHMCMFFSAFYCVLSKVVYMSIIFNLKKAFDIFSFELSIILGSSPQGAMLQLKL